MIRAGRPSRQIRLPICGSPAHAGGTVSVADGFRMSRGVRCTMPRDDARLVVNRAAISTPSHDVAATPCQCSEFRFSTSRYRCCRCRWAVSTALRSKFPEDQSLTVAHCALRWVPYIDSVRYPGAADKRPRAMIPTRPRQTVEMRRRTRWVFMQRIWGEIMFERRRVDVRHTPSDFAEGHCRGGDSAR